MHDRATTHDKFGTIAVIWDTVYAENFYTYINY